MWLSLVFGLFAVNVLTTLVNGQDPPTWINDMNALRIEEDTAVGTVVYTLLAQGGGPDGITYDMLETDKFIVNRATGEVKLRRLLDYETNPTLLVTVLATGSNGLT
ncbi:protocadherin beta-5-like, partial [Saccostrea cucullata]|uniref:protocadherin beta-5-like n=1 Tax=Saccostrea cuccullata TaxID=36930 RepID=UPI002ED4130F